MAKYCPKCYVGIGDEDAVCSNCGAVLKENVTPETGSAAFEDQKSDSPESASPANAGGTEAENTFPGVIAAETVTNNPNAAKVATPKPASIDKTETVMTLGDWMLTLLLTYIPIVNIIMLIIWSVDASTNVNKKHFAWASLIFMGIGIVLTIIFSSIVFAIMASAMHSMRYY